MPQICEHASVFAIAITQNHKDERDHTVYMGIGAPIFNQKRENGFEYALKLSACNSPPNDYSEGAENLHNPEALGHEAICIFADRTEFPSAPMS